MGLLARGGPPKDKTITLDLTAEQAGKIVKVRQLRGMTTGEVVRRACAAIDEAALRRDPAPCHDRHLRVLVPVSLRRKIERLAVSCDMRICDVVRRACEAEFDRQLSGKQ